MEKIPSELRLIISRKFGSKETWDLDVLLNALKSELEARKKVQCSENKYRCSPTNSISIKQKETNRILQPGDLMLLQQKQRNETL